MRHFLKLSDLSRNEIINLTNRAIALKHLHRSDNHPLILKNKTLAMIFYKESTRTRVSFEAGMAQSGGQALFIPSGLSQITRGESTADSSRVISSMVDLIMIRTFKQKDLEEFASVSRVPVINGLSDEYHPCQLLADIMTFQELRGDLRGKSVAWVGDCNNVTRCFIEAAQILDFKLKVACPPQYINSEFAQLAGEFCQYTDSPAEAVSGADLVVTDVWVSMGMQDEQQRLADFKNYQVTSDLLNQAKNEVLFMHCLPAHRGLEVSAEVMQDKRACVWQEAENRLHSQKALMEFLLALAH